MRDSSRPPYLKRSPSSAARVTRHDRPVEPFEQRLEVDVPDPRHVAAVGDRVVQRDDGDARRAAVDERAHDLVRAGRILDQEEQQLLAVDRDALEPAEGGAEAGEPRDDLVERRAERLRERRSGERVVDVVEARASASSTRARSRRRDEIERDPLEAVQLDRAGRDVERGPRVAAVRAAVVAEVPDVGGAVVIGRPAADAVLRVGRVLERRAGEARVVEAEDDECARASASEPTLRIVAVHDEDGRRPAAPRPPRASARRSARARRSGRAGRGRDCRGRRPGAGRAGAPPGSAASSTSSRPSSASPAARRVEATPETRFAPEWLCASRNRGRRISAAIAVVVVLPFVAEMHGGAGRQPRRQPVDRARVELREELSRHGHAGAARRARRERPATRRAARISAAVSTGRAYATVGIPRSSESPRP